MEILRLVASRVKTARSPRTIVPDDNDRVRVRWVDPSVLYHTVGDGEERRSNVTADVQSAVEVVSTEGLVMRDGQ